ncbi:hypothetical protein CYMTET_30777, partial [Cymbomonas tetramitiformis]
YPLERRAIEKPGRFVRVVLNQGGHRSGGTAICRGTGCKSRRLRCIFLLPQNKCISIQCCSYCDTQPSKLWYVSGAAGASRGTDRPKLHVVAYTDTACKSWEL